MGIWSCLGYDLDTVREALYNGKSGIVFDQTRKDMGFRSALTAFVEKPDLKKLIPRNQRQFMPEEAQYAYCSTRQALEQAGITQEFLDQHEVGILFGNDSVAQATYKAVSKIYEYKDTAACGSGSIFQSMNSTVTMNLATLFHLRGINLTINKGQTIAIVGQSGSGKSTLVDLIPRYYDVQEGEVLIDGINVKELGIHDLRQLIGNVNQEAILFNDSFRNNIAFGVENATQEQIEEAARIANAYEFIMASELGFDTNIGDRGSRLSGGQRQRVSIARAILKNPPILILDEATSALDTESERLVQDALERLMKTRTTVAIAHRLSTIKNADEICVLHEGCIVERGTHDELLSIDGYYKKLHEMQS